MALRDMEDIVQRALAVGLVGPEKRRQLLHGLPMGFVYSLPTVSRPIDQLRFDLMELGRTPRLIGLADPPLAVWLRNAALVAQAQFPDAAVFFAQKAAALDGKPLGLDAQAGSQAAPAPSVGPVAGATVNRVGNVGQGGVGIVEGNVTINNNGGAGGGAADRQQAAPRGNPAPPAPLTDRDLIVLAVGVPEADARAAVGPDVKIRKIVLVDAPAATWEHPPTQEAWGRVSRLIEVRLEDWLDPDAPADIALVGELPAAMSAWFVHAVRQINPQLVAHVADPPWFSSKNRWHFPRPVPAAQASAIDVVVDGPTTDVRALAVYVELSSPRRRPAQAGCKTTAVLRARDRGWRHGDVRPAALARSLADALGELQDRFPDATWHVFYEGPPSLWCTTVAQALRDRQPMTIYAADIDRTEHPALTLPHGVWQARLQQTEQTDAYDAFIAYPAEARDLATTLYERLNSAGCNVFVEEVSLEFGDVRNQVIDDALQSARLIVVMVTPATPRDWYDHETVVTAVDLAQRPGAELRIVPMLVGGVSFDEIPRGLRRLVPAKLPRGRLDDKTVTRLTGLIQKSAPADDT